MVSANRIEEFLQPSQRFARSVHLERDFADSTALDQYVVTERVTQLFRRFASSFAEGATERAWRVTGDYGTGKSCFALVIARLLSGRSSRIPPQLASLSKVLPQADAFPVLVTGTREPISIAIIRAIEKTLEKSRSKKRPPELRKAKRVLREAIPTDRDRYAIELLEATTHFVQQTRRGNGVLLILDELGKSLEFANEHPDQQDMTFLQTLAEVASRSGSSPLVILGILHQGFSTYADRMEANDQREWDKIGGRFEELVFDQPLEQLVSLVSSALGVKTDRIPPAVMKAARTNMEQAIELGWFGAVSDRKALLNQATSIYPLQPMLLPVLVKFFSRFGQNERSLFSFLYSADVNALRSFAVGHDAGAGFFGIHHLYDFVRSTIGYRLHTRALSSRWSQIESVINASLSQTPDEVAMLKTVGVLNMLDDQTLRASDDALKVALHQTCIPGRWSFDATLGTLRNKKRVLYCRGASGGNCLWPYTSVNLELKYAEAEKTIRKDSNVVDAVAENLLVRPIVARRHYVATGNLRHFDLLYVKASELADVINGWDPDEADGAVFVPLCQTVSECVQAKQSISKLGLHQRPEILIAIPRPLSGFSGLVAELRRWEWVATSTPELDGDKHGREEVSRQVSAAKSVLLERINRVLDVRSFRTGEGMGWFHCGKPIELTSSRELFARVSTICDRVFPDSPRLRNELLNRRKLSSAAAAARIRLIERVLDNATEDMLGMDPVKKPPEMAMYLSALKNAGLHVAGRSSSRISIPKEGQDSCNLLPLFSKMRDVLVENEGKRVALSDLFAALRRKPVGARDGLLPLMLAVFCVAEAQHIAMYEDGRFLQDISGAAFHRLSKAPETFELQYCKLSGVRSEVFNQLLSLVDAETDETRPADLIDVVRPLVKFAATLPDFSRNTSGLSKSTLAVRDALMNATEPATLLFEELPAACGQPAIAAGRRAKDDGVKKYVRALKKSLGELRSAYPNLLSRIEIQLAVAFDSESNPENTRTRLQMQSKDLSLHVTEPTLKAFCLRLADASLPRDTWLESLGSLVLAKPPRRWLDRDEAGFNEAIAELAKRFVQTASLAFSKGATPSSESFRVSFLRSDGTEESRVMRIDNADKKRAQSLEAHLVKLIDANPDLGMSIAAKVLMLRMGTKK